MSNVSNVSPIRATNTTLQVLVDKWPVIAGGFCFAAVLAISILTLSRVNEMQVQVNTAVDKLNRSIAADGVTAELARTRYEDEIRELHELKVKIDTASAWYQQDIRDLLRK